MGIETNRVRWDCCGGGYPYQLSWSMQRGIGRLYARCDFWSKLFNAWTECSHEMHFAAFLARCMLHVLCIGVEHFRGRARLLQSLRHPIGWSGYGFKRRVGGWDLAMAARLNEREQPSVVDIKSSGKSAPSSERFLGMTLALPSPLRQSLPHISCNLK